MSLIRVSDARSVNKEDVMAVELQSRHYVNGSDHALEITMRNGERFYIKHQSHLLGGVDVFDLKRKLEE